MRAVLSWLERHRLPLTLTIGAIVVAAIAYYAYAAERGPVADLGLGSGPTPTYVPYATPTAPGIKVYVTGSVNHPGVYTLTLGDLDARTASSGNSLLAVVMQLSMSLGVATSSTFLLLFSGGEGSQVGQRGLGSGQQVGALVLRVRAGLVDRQVIVRAGADYQIRIVQHPLRTDPGDGDLVVGANPTIRQSTLIGGVEFAAVGDQQGIVR